MHARGRVVCVGGATLDRTYRLDAPLVAGTSNSAAGRRGFGGVARNVAENLGRLGADVALVSCVGDDEGGQTLVAALASVRVDVRGIGVAPGATTAEYAAVLDPDGELALGLADMAVLERLTPAMLAGRADLLAGADWLFADCNLPPESLAWLAGRAAPDVRYRFAVDAVSVAKSARLPRRLDGIDLLFLNRDEAEAIVGRQQPEEAARALLSAGAGAVVLTLGIGGALATTRDGVVAVPPVPARVVSVTGAGDSLVAATLCGLLSGLALPQAVALGCRAAAHTLGCHDAVSPRLAAALMVEGTSLDA